MKTAIIISASAALIFMITVSTGFYPVAWVEGTPILFHTWQKAQKGLIAFTQIQLQTAGSRLIDFSSLENAELFLDVKRGTLTFLIEDALLRREGGNLIKDFGRLAEERVDGAIGKKAELERAARLIYGLEFKDFRNLVLMPQARRDILQEKFSGEGGNFEEWFSEIKKSKSVRLFLVPFQWNGEHVE